jgi:hypothetical protein
MLRNKTLVFIFVGFGNGLKVEILARKKKGNRRFLDWNNPA